MIGDMEDGSAMFSDTLFDSATIAPLFGDMAELQDQNTMANDAGYVHIKFSIPKDQAENLAEEVTLESDPITVQDKWNIYSMSLQGRQAIRLFVENRLDRLKEFVSPDSLSPDPPHAAFGMFRPTQETSKVWRASEDHVFVTIALTPLDHGNGWYTLMEGSHRQPRTPSSQLKETNLKLAAGDAIIWRGNLGVKKSPNGGGKFLNVTYTIKKITHAEVGQRAL